jgi:hypothetical protein
VRVDIRESLVVSAVDPGNALRMRMMENRNVDATTASRKGHTPARNAAQLPASATRPTSRRRLQRVQVKRLRWQVVTVQPAGPQLFQPAVFDRDNRGTRPEEPLDLSLGRFAIGVVRHAGAFTRDQVVAEALRVYGPYGGLDSVFGCSRLESNAPALHGRQSKKCRGAPVAPPVSPRCSNRCFPDPSRSEGANGWGGAERQCLMLRPSHPASLLARTGSRPIPVER